MIAIVLAIITIVGAVEFLNFCFDDTYDTKTIARGRSGAVAVAVGMVGLVALGLRACL